MKHELLSQEFRVGECIGACVVVCLMCFLSRDNWIYKSNNSRKVWLLVDESVVTFEFISRHAKDNTLGGGSLGSYVDEERSELRDLM